MEKGCTAEPPFAVCVTDLGVWTFPEHPQTPEAQVLLPHPPSWPCLPGQVEGFAPTEMTQRPLLGQIADNFQHLRQENRNSVPSSSLLNAAKQNTAKQGLPTINSFSSCTCTLVWSLFCDHMPSQACDEANALTMAHLTSRSGAEHIETQN